MRQFVFVLIWVCMSCTAYATTCTENQYVSDGVCVNCIYNATCDGNTYKCNDGFYDSGENECVACPPNSVCTSATEFTCLPGAYLSDGVCNVCPENATCDGGAASFRCNAGWYQYHNQCMNCDGQICDGDTLQSCGSGFVRYPFGDTLKPHQQYCMKCNVGYYCPSGTTRYICDTGYYKNGNGTCSRCPSEYYCPLDSDITNMYDYCSPGYYRAGKSCSKCDDNIECPGGVQIECSDGLIAHSNGQCLPYAENDPGISGECHPGFYDTGAQCLACTSNSICSSIDDFQCRAGFYKNGTHCDICPDNSACPESSTQITCLPGYWLNGNVCDQCGNVSYCRDNVKYDCPPFNPDNFYLFDEGSVVLSWTDVYSSAKPISSSSNSCVVGRVYVKSPRGEYIEFWPAWSESRGQYYSGNRSWQTAATGYYLADEKSINADIFYQNNFKCTNAPEHSTYTGSGSPNGNDCPWRCDDGYLRDGNTCTMCPAGYTCVNGLLVCPLGQYADGMTCNNCPEFYDARATENSAPQSINECQIKCDGGTYLAAANGTECAPVGTAFWNPINYTYYGSVGTRQQCPDNLTTLGYGAGADDASDCGKVLHIGKYTVHLRSGKKTSPSLVVQYGERMLYGDMLPDMRGYLRTEYNGVTYSVSNIDME